jgi:hypothetical protein
VLILGAFDEEKLKYKAKVENQLMVGTRWHNYHTQVIFVVKKIKGLSVIAKNEVSAKMEKIHRSEMSRNFELME